MMDACKEDRISSLSLMFRLSIIFSQICLSVITPNALNNINSGITCFTLGI